MPSTPQALGTACSPSVEIYDQNLPCDVLTIYFYWGDGTTSNLVCNPAAPATQCVFDLSRKTLTAMQSYTHKAQGTYTVTVIVVSQGYAPPQKIPNGNSAGKGWTSFSLTFVVYDASLGRCDGTPVISSGWIGKGQTTGGSGLTNLPSTGSLTASFTASFTENNYTVLSASGYTTISLQGFSGPIFTSTSVDHLTLFGKTNKGAGALWSGKGSYSLLPGIEVTFQVYAFDGSIGPSATNQDLFHIVIEASNGTTLFDSAPDYAIDDPKQPSVASGLVTISNAPPTPVSAITETQYDQQSSALVGVSVLAGILGVALIGMAIALVYVIQFRKVVDSKTTATVVPELGK